MKGIPKIVVNYLLIVRSEPYFTEFQDENIFPVAFNLDIVSKICSMVSLGLVEDLVLLGNPPNHQLLPVVRRRSHGPEGGG